MRVLVACEFSGVVREAFRALGHDAWSCDLLPAKDGSAFHLQGDARGHPEVGIRHGQPAVPQTQLRPNHGLRRAKNLERSSVRNGAG